MANDAAVSAWKVFLDRLAEPGLQNAMFMLGTQLLQPVPVGQTPTGFVGQALQNTLQSYAIGKARREKERKEEERFQKKIGIEERKAAASEKSAKAAETVAEARAREATARAKAIEAGRPLGSEGKAAIIARYAEALQARGDAKTPEEAYAKAVERLNPKKGGIDPRRVVLELYKARLENAPLTTDQEKLDAFANEALAAAKKDAEILLGKGGESVVAETPSEPQGIPGQEKPAEGSTIEVDPRSGLSTSAVQALATTPPKVPGQVVRDKATGKTAVAVGGAWIPEDKLKAFTLVRGKPEGMPAQGTTGSVLDVTSGTLYGWDGQQWIPTGTVEHLYLGR